jgi:hypothetical protein
MAKRGNPAMKRGEPSINPLGRAAPVAKSNQPAGTDGVASYTGYVLSGERNPDLVGQKKWVTLSNALNKAIVATGVRYFTNLLSGTDWYAEPNEDGGKGATKGVDLVTKGLLQAPLVKPWSQVVRKQALYRMLGNAIHATSLRRRASDGLIVYAAIAHRPQHTIERWNRPDEFSPWDSIDQRSTQSGQLINVSLDECWYSVDDTISDTPDGVGLLRHIIDHVRRLEIYEALEGKAYSEDLGGVPIGRAPLAEIERAVGAPGKTAADVKAAKDQRTQPLRDVLDKRKRTPDQSQWLLLDSDVYANADQTKTNIPKWGLDLVKSETPNLPDINTLITRVRFEIACALGIEWVLLGSGDNGSFALSADKTSMFASTLQTTLTELAYSATNQLARRLVAANGLDPDTCTPRLVAEPISTDAIETCTRSLANLAMAGLPPNDPARNVIRSRMRLPPEPDYAYDLIKPTRLIPAIGDPKVPPPGEAEVAPQKPGSAPPPPPAANATQDPTGAEQLRAGTKKRAPGFSKGASVECLVNHMPGMKGMSGTIAIAREGTPPYYGVRFDDQKAMPGVHKWLAEDEIKAADEMGAM